MWHVHVFEGHVMLSICILRASLIPVKFESFFGLLRKWHICSFTLCCPLNAEIHDLEILIFLFFSFSKMFIPFILIKVESSFLYQLEGLTWGLSLAMPFVIF